MAHNTLTVTHPTTSSFTRSSHPRSHRKHNSVSQCINDHPLYNFKRTMADPRLYYQKWADLEAKSLNLNSHMDFGILANLLRNLDEQDGGRIVDNLSMYRVDLDYNVSWEVMDQLFRYKTVEMDYCEGSHLHAVLSRIFQQANIQRLSLISLALNDLEIDALDNGLQSEHHGLKELCLTIEMSTKTTRVLCQAINKGASLKKIPTLVTLDLSRCEFGSDAIEAFCEGLQENKSLVCLKLESCRLEDYEVAEVARSLRRHPTLRELSFRMNYAEDESMEAISELLLQTTALESLDLAQQNPGILDLVTLAEALQHNHTLRRLNVKESYVFDTHMEALAETLATKNCTLEELNMESCGIKDSGLIFFLERLNKFKMTKLWFKGNHFHDHKLLSDDNMILPLLEQNRMLQTLDFEDEMEIGPTLWNHLFLNRGGRKFLTPNCVPLSLWPILLARVNTLLALGEDRDSGGGGHDNDGNSSQAVGVPDLLFFLLLGPALFDR